MSHLDDLPRRHSSHHIEDRSKTVFRVVISECHDFIIQSDDRDYGTDFVIEAIDAGQPTNVRVHVQIKGTNCNAREDGSISVSVARSNVNYLLMQPGSVFVCYHVPTERLLVRRADDIAREYEHRGKDWHGQQTVTVRFEEAFDRDFQRSLKHYVVASAKGERDRRLNLAIHPPNTLSIVREEGAIDLPVSADPTQARRVLVELYESGQDKAISLSFDKFRAVLGSSDQVFLRAYMAEINLGINGPEFDVPRIREGIDALLSAIDDGQQFPGAILYAIGNGWLALKEYKKARDAYNSALCLLDEFPGVAAQCCKNLGTTLARLQHHDAARTLYERALDLDANLGEAHFALALWHHEQKAGDPARALEHLDAVVWPKSSAGTQSAVQGWRAAILFEQQRVGEASREVRALLASANRLEWVWPWCAWLVATHGRSSTEAARFAVSFWRAYLDEFSGDHRARMEMLFCVDHLHDGGESTGWDYDRFRRAVETTITEGDADAAFLWDRVGHWAQSAGDWTEAETCYRKAFELSPNSYGYCLGTALNFLQRFEEAVTVLLPQTTQHQPDAMSWFQLAVGREGIGDVPGCVIAYKRALALDNEYDLAWFNLGGVYWNSGDEASAVATWKEAIRRFPTHALSARLRRDLPHLF